MIENRMHIIIVIFHWMSLQQPDGVSEMQGETPKVIFLVKHGW
jgi:hypothetical protein